MDQRATEKPSWHPASPAYSDHDRDKTVVVHFWAEWDGYDLRMDEILQGLRAEFETSMPIRSCDIDREANWALAREAGVANVPALAVVVNGEPKDLITGLRSADEIKAKLEQWRQTVSGAI